LWTLFALCQCAGMLASEASLQLLYTPIPHVSVVAGVMPSWLLSVVFLVPGYFVWIALSEILFPPFSQVRFVLAGAGCVLVNAGTWWTIAKIVHARRASGRIVDAKVRHFLSSALHHPVARVLHEETRACFLV